MAHDVFISYSAKDKPVADAVCATLESRAVRCWIAPRDILAGTDWSASIIEAINHSKIFILIYSASANESPQIRREVERAVNKRLAVLPFRIEDVPMSESLEYFISTPHWLDALSPPLTQHLDALANAVTALLQREPGPRPPSPRPQPAPPPVPGPSPVPGRRPPILWIAVAAVLLIGLAAFLFRPRSSADLDGRFVGSWNSQVQNAGFQCAGTSDLKRTGAYESEIVCKDSGVFSADAQGRYRTAPSSQPAIDGSYRFLDPNRVEMASALGTAVWIRKSQAVAGLPFAGTWETSTPLPNGNWLWTFEISPDGRYDVTFRRKDAGTFQAVNGQWRTVSSLQPADGGTYNFVNDDSVEMMGMLGKGLWTRK